MNRYQKGKTSLDFTEARDSERQWHQLGHMQVCTSLQTDNHASTPLSVFYRPDAVPATQPTASKHCTVSNPTNSRCTAVNVKASGGLRTLDPLRTPHFPPPLQNPGGATACKYVSVHAGSLLDYIDRVCVCRQAGCAGEPAGQRRVCRALQVVVESTDRRRRIRSHRHARSSSCRCSFSLVVHVINCVQSTTRAAVILWILPPVFTPSFLRPDQLISPLD